MSERVSNGRLAPRNLTDILASFPPINHGPVDKKAYRAALTALRKYSQSPAGVEPVAWQRRLMNPVDDVNGHKAGAWGTWKECSREQAEYAMRTGGVEGFSPPLLAEARPLYASPPPKAVTITDEMVDRVFQAVWDCPHSIDGSAVTLRIDPTKPGNALSQLRQRLAAALSSEGHNG